MALQNNSKKLKHLLAITDLSKKQILDLISLAQKVKKNPEKYSHFLEGKSLVMIFQKTSTRTRLSFEIGMTQLGGHAAFLDWKASNFQVGDLLDEVRCIGRYADILMARVYAHSDVVAMSKAAGIPVINGLCDLEHPCQILADILTMQEHCGSLSKIKIAYVGDGNNVCNSLIAACSILGISISVATPKGFEPNKDIIALGKKSKMLTLINDQKRAVIGADIVYTDTWVSLGQEAQTKKRLKAFEGYQLNKTSVPKNAKIMHCLPAHRGIEISSELLDSKQSIVFDQSENRLHMQKAIMLTLMGKGGNK